MRLKDRVAIITGAAQGIGKATAALFHREGAKLVLCDMDLATLEAAAKEIAPNADHIRCFACNVSKKEDCESVVAKTMESFGKVDILVNNAGITRDNLVLRMKEEEWDAVINVNLKGAFYFIKAVIHPMFKARYGRIVNLASVVGQYGNPGQANYAASKGGLISMTKSMAKEFAPRNVLCNCVAPGFVRTRLTEVLPEEIKKQFMSMTALARFAEPEEIAKVCLFLSSDDCSYMTGQVLGVNGGLYM